MAQNPVCLRGGPYEASDRDSLQVEDEEKMGWAKMKPKALTIFFKVVI